MEHLVDKEVALTPEPIFPLSSLAPNRTGAREVALTCFLITFKGGPWGFSAWTCRPNGLLSHTKFICWGRWAIFWAAPSKTPR